MGGRKRKSSTASKAQAPPAEDIAIDSKIALGKEEWDEEDKPDDEGEVSAEEGEFGDIADFNSNSEEDDEEEEEEDIAGELNEDDEEDEDGVSEEEDGEVDEDDISEGIDESYEDADGAGGSGDEDDEEGDDMYPLIHLLYIKHYFVILFFNTKRYDSEDDETAYHKAHVNYAEGSDSSEDEVYHITFPPFIVFILVAYSIILTVFVHNSLHFPYTSPTSRLLLSHSQILFRPL